MTERMMNFGVITAPKKVEMHQRPVPGIKDNQILIKLKACNICSTDYGQWSGARSSQPFPMAGGHENAGTIIEKGSSVKDNLKVGDQVAFAYYNCGACESCRKGNTFECKYEERFHKSEDGYYGDFGYGEYKVVEARLAIKISSEISAGEAGFMEPVATVVSGMKKLRIKPLDSVVVLGAGTMGLINAQAARAYGARVFITEIMEKKLGCARELGFENVIDAAKSDPVATFKQMNGGKGADAVILAVGVSSANQQALEIAKSSGAKILFFAAGYPEPELKIGSNAIHYKNIELIGTFGANFSDFQDAADMLSLRAINMKPLIEASYPLNEIEKAYELASKAGSYRVTVNL